jgi:peptidoglycan/LPS O-acetylase OafA/YrhL
MSSATAEARQVVPPPEPPVAARLGWLDVLRGIAALVVALHHATYWYIPRLRTHYMVDWFDPGKYGVLAFFLVSGYIVPASLERHGSIRRFWISRAFRIYPLLVLACAVGVLPFLLGIRGLRQGLEHYDPVTAVLAHLTMLQDVLAVPNVINVLWTLSYEMVFYLLIVALFVTRTHRRSVPIAVILALAALPAGVLLPTTALSRATAVGTVVIVTAVLLVVALAAALSGRPALRTAGGLLGGAVAVVLVTVNGRAGAWESMVILAIMFTGTVIYRAEQGQIGRRTAVPAVGIVLAGIVAAGAWNAWYGLPRAAAHEFAVYWTGSVLLAGLTFGVLMALRYRRMPRWLTGLGVISYSVYLLHPVLLMLSDEVFGTPDHDRPLGLLIFVAVLLMVSWTTHRFIETPMQSLGRRLARRVSS